MYKVFINSLTVFFVKDLSCCNDLSFNSIKKIHVTSPYHDIFTEIQNSLSNKTNIETLVFIDSNVESLWKKFVSNYDVRIAGGGLVSNLKNEFLLIFRNNKWDLPKGHIEKGERIETGAIREVEEECGISSPKVITKLTETYHTYTHKGKAILKHTHWFLMSYNGNEALLPQIEEGITRVEWKNLKDTETCIMTSYKSIIDVWKSFTKLMDKHKEK